MRVALYERVSARDKDRNPENQLQLLRREAERADDTIMKEYVDEASRKQFEELMRDASMAWAASYRNERHSEKVHLGQARKRARVEAAGEQYQHGRRPLGSAMILQIQHLANQGLSRRQIAASAGVSVGTVQNYLKAAFTH